MHAMKSPDMSNVTEEDGHIIVHFSVAYGSWTPAQVEVLVTNFANADACLSGKARRIEFQSPSGRVIARADGVRGIRMMTS